METNHTRPAMKAIRLACDHPDCDATLLTLAGETRLPDVAAGAYWANIDGRWFCPNHWTFDADDNIVELSDDDPDSIPTAWEA